MSRMNRMRGGWDIETFLILKILEILKILLQTAALIFI